MQNDRLTEEVLSIVEEQTGQLRKDLIVKERETLEVLKHLEITKKALDDLRSKLSSESTDKESQIEVRPSSSSSPGLILMQLKQARLNLNSFFDLAGIRRSVQMFKNEIHKEKISMEKTRVKIASNCSRISSLEKDLNQTGLVSQFVQEPGFPQISRKLHELRSETEQFRKMEACSKSEVSKMKEEIEGTKAKIKTIQIRINAAQKLEEEAKTNAQQLVDVPSEVIKEDPPGVTLLLEDYNALVQRAHDAEERSKEKIESAMIQVDEANKSKMEMLRKVGESNSELVNRRKVLDEALHRVDKANQGKLSVEESLRKWRSEHFQIKRRSSVYNSPRFKTPSSATYASSSHHHRRSSKPPDAPRTSSLSIGQILNRKLADPEDVENLNIVTSKELTTRDSPKLSLAQMLNTRHESCRDLVTAPCKSFHAKKKKNKTKKTVGFVGRFPLMLLLLNRYNKKR